MWHFQRVYTYITAAVVVDVVKVDAVNDVAADVVKIGTKPKNLWMANKHISD